MGESACLRRSFSHPADSSREIGQGDPIRALTDSISFGKFMSESLAWEKFSTFSHNRYLEEVEKFSKPGAVAEKKAYFEAHFKRRAAMRAAAVAEETKMESADAFQMGTVLESRNECSSNEMPLAIDEKQDTSVSEAQVPGGFDVDKCNPNVLEEQLVTEENHSEEKLSHNETSTCVESANNNDLVVEIAKEFSDNSTTLSKKRRTSSPSNSSSKSKASKLPLCSFKPSTPLRASNGDDNSVDISSKKGARVSNEKKRRIPNSVQMSINFASSDGGMDGMVQMPKDSPTPKQTPMKILKKAAAQFNLVLSSHKGQLNFAVKSSTHGGAPKDRSTPAKQATTRIGNDDAIKNKKSVGDPNEKKKPFSKSLHMSMNFASCANETSKMSLRMPRDLSTPVQVPIKAPVNVESKNPSKVLQSEDRSSSKPSNPSRSKVQPFSFRSDERATKRKEFFQKIEENSKELDKLQMQTRSKGKADNRFNMFRQSTGLKAGPPEDHSHGSQSPTNHTKKISLTRPRSPKLGRKPSNSMQEASARPPPKHSINTGKPKRAAPKNSRSSMKVTSLAKNRHENASPNIQLSVR